MLLLSRKALKAANIIAPKGDIRYYLNGVYLEKTPSGDLHYVSTDGHRMFVGRTRPTWTKDEIDGLWTMIIPKDVVERATKGRSSHDWIELKPVAETNGMYQLGDIIFTPVEGLFPDWRRVLPAWDAMEEKPAQFNWDYITQCQDALRAWYDSKKLVPYLRMNGENTALMTGRDENAFCVIMPLRDSGYEHARKPFTPAPKQDDRVTLAKLHADYDAYAFALLETGATPLSFDTWVSVNYEWECRRVPEAA